MVEKKIQLFLLPFAGGSTLSFIRMVRLLNPGIAPITVEYAGRGSRKQEPLINNYNDFLDDVVTYILKHRLSCLPFAILGYSLGSVIAFDICCKQLLDQKAIYCFFCAEGSLLSNSSVRKYGSLPRKDFLDRMKMLGGLDKRILNDKQILNNYLDLIRNDFDILGQYSYKSGIVETDASILYSPDDSSCTAMEEWSKLITGQVKYYKIGHDHFFVNHSYKEMAEIINDNLAKFIK